MVFILGGVVGVIAICFILLFLAISLRSRPTTGERIGEYPNPKSAILIIDVQEDFTGITATKPFPYPDSESMIATINRSIDMAIAREITVVYIGYEVEDNLFFRCLGGKAIKGRPGTKMDKRLKIVSPNYFAKDRADAFCNIKLNDFLVANHIAELYLAGLDAGGCVFRTAQGAINRGYSVTLLEDAAISFKHKKEIIQKYLRIGATIRKSLEIK